jgi:hypothetical protein
MSSNLPVFGLFNSLTASRLSEAKEETAVAVVVDAKIDYPSGDAIILISYHNA